MTYTLKVNKKVENLLKKVANLAKKNKHNIVTVPHLISVLINEEEVISIMEREMDFEDDKINEISNFFLSEILSIDDYQLKDEDEEKSTFMMNDFISDMISFSQDLSDDDLEKIDEIDIFSLIILKLKKYKDIGIHTKYYEAFFDEMSNHQQNYVINSFKNAISNIENREDEEIDFDEISIEESSLKTLIEEAENDFKHQKDSKSKNKMPPYLVNLNEKVINFDDYELIYSNKDLIARINYTLSKKDKSMPIIVGDNGVGKTTLIHSFCKELINGDVSPMLANKKIIEVDLVKLFAGCMYRGSLEEKISEMFKFLSSEKNVILFVDNLRVNKNSNQQEEFISSFIHYLKNYNIKCIFSMDYKEYQKSLKTHPQVSSSATIIEVEEPSEDRTFEMVNLNISKYEKYHNIHYPEALIKRVIKLSNKYLSDKKNPSKSFEIIDELGALKSSGIINRDEISIDDVLKIISEKSKVNIKDDKDEVVKYINLEKEIKKQIFGQDHVIESLASSIMISAAGFNDEEKPYLSLMFTGTTGVGKTEMVKQLSKKLDRKMIRFDMSEYSESHTVSKLIGSPSGYVGHDDGGLLTNEIKRNPYSIVLFDEIEKGHPKVFDLFLQILDEGFLTDSQGIKVSFKNSIVVFTSNAGVSEKSKSTIGFSDDISTNKIDFDILSKYFKPEFLNRINSVVEFNMLDKSVMKDIANKYLNNFEMKLREKNIRFNATPKVKEYLSENGYDERLGARPMDRLVQKEIIESFSKKYIMLKSQKKEPSCCDVSVKNKEINIKVY